jgi:hypothetical protein
MKRKKAEAVALPQYLADAIRQAWPDGVVETLGSCDEAPLWDVWPNLRTSLAGIPGAHLLWERDPESVLNLACHPDDDEEQEDPPWQEGSRSYCLFFLSPTDKRFEFETETVEPDEDDIEQKIPGRGWMGCVVAVSFVAPFAAIGFDELEEFESGSRTEPDVEPHMFNVGGGKLDMEARYRELFGEEGVSILKTLQARIASVLKKHEITVIPDEDLDRPVPWLRADEEVLVGHQGEPITVQHAFFFWTL